MTSKELKDLLASNGQKIKRYYENEAYYRGRNPAIYAKLPEADPDHRVPVPFIKVAVDTLAGYMVKPGNVSYYGDGAQKLLPYYNYNEEQLITMELFKTACVHGESYEVHWWNNGDNFAQIPYAQGIPIWSDEIKPTLTAFAWTRQLSTGNVVVIYTPTTVQTWQESKIEYVMVGEELHGYGKVPVIVYRINSEGTNLFDHVKELVDLYDRLISHDIANELERFAKAYLLYANSFDSIPGDDGLTDLDKIKQARTFEQLGDNVSSKVAFLTKNIQSDFIRFSSETVRDLIYEMLQIPNPNDAKTFSGASGYAMMLKNMTFEFLCSSIEGVFSRGLQDRIRLIAGHVLAGFDGQNVFIKWSRNIPFDLQSMATVAAQLSGTLDIEAILTLFPDSILPPEAKKRIIEGKQVNLDTIADVMGQGEDGNNAE